MSEQKDFPLLGVSKDVVGQKPQTLSAVVLDRLHGQTRSDDLPNEASALEAKAQRTPSELLHLHSPSVARSYTDNRQQLLSTNPPAASSGETVTALLLRERCLSSSWKPDAGSIMLEEALDSTISHEEFRRLRSYLYEVRRKQPLRRLLISSALSGEGKTFVSANLAQTMARRPNESVLVVDGDLRLSRLHRPLGAAAGPGLSEYLEGDADIFSVIQRGPMDNLFFVAGGTPKTNPADLISNGRLEVFLQRLAPAFDWIVLDSPPALLVTDATLLATLCDGILLVIRAGLTSVDVARKALQMFRNKPLLGTVLNGSRPRTPYADYYGRSQATAPKKGHRK
jgi:capsular exopolysaccharide synthesis family protein